MPLTLKLFRLSIITACASISLNVSAQSSEKYLNDSLPQSWIFDSRFDQTIPTDDDWWQTLNDSILNFLIKEGVKNNYNLLIASRRIEIAHNAMKMAQSSYYPAVNLNGGWSKNQTTGLVYDSHGKASRTSEFSLGFDLSWEIDLFGKIRAGVNQKKSQLQATKAEYAGVMVSLCGQIASNYIQLRTWQAELAVANEHLDSQARIVKLTEARKEAGLASDLDVSQALIVYNSTKSTIPSLENSIHTAINSIALLIGCYPHVVYNELSQPKALPDYRQIVGTGIPMELLRRRPDVVQAEKELASYADAIGVAKKDFLPTLSLNGSIGTAAHSAKNLFKAESFTYSIAPTLSWTVFDGLQRKYRVAGAREQMQIGIDNYNQIVMTAVEETDNAMFIYLTAIRQINDIQEVIDQSKRALDLSLDLYKRGLTSFNNVVTAQMSLLEYQDRSVVAKGTALSSLVKLYVALGGGWDVTRL